MTAVHRVHSRAQPPHQVHGHQVRPVTTDRAEESQRIARAIEQAQLAQDGFCWQTLGPTVRISRKTQAISRAMEQALAKYQTHLQQRGSATPPPIR